MPAVFTAAAAALSIAVRIDAAICVTWRSRTGVQLLQRGPRGVRDAEGATLYESSQRMLAESAHVETLLTNGDATSASTVVLGVSPTLTQVLLPGDVPALPSQPGVVHLVVREAAHARTLLEKPRTQGNGSTWRW